MTMTSTAVFTDGACIGKESNRFAGYGVFWGLDDARNVSASLTPGTPQTNQRAELRAVVHALEQISEAAAADSNRSFVIYTDSKWSIDAITKWRANWQRNGWLTAAKEPVKHQDLIRHAGNLYDALHPHRVTIEWVKGHSSSEGNRAADLLATRAAAAAAANAALL